MLRGGEYDIALRFYIQLSVFQLKREVIKVTQRELLRSLESNYKYLKNVLVRRILFEGLQFSAILAVSSELKASAAVFNADPKHNAIL